MKSLLVAVLAVLAAWIFASFTYIPISMVVHLGSTGTGLVILILTIVFARPVYRNFANRWLKQPAAEQAA